MFRFGQLGDLFTDSGNAADFAGCGVVLAAQHGIIWQLIHYQCEQVLGTGRPLRHIIAGNVTARVQPFDFNGVHVLAGAHVRPVRRHVFTVLIKHIEHGIRGPVWQPGEQGEHGGFGMGGHFCAQGQHLDNVVDLLFNP